MQFESVAISSLVPDPANARKHSKKNLDAIKGSLAKFGQVKPIVVDGNNIVVAGNGTMAAAVSLGWDKLSIVRTHLTGPDAIAFALADNRTAELAEWDLETMGPILQSLKDIDFDLGSIGFDETDLAKLTPEVVKEGLIGDDEIPEAAETRCKAGDLWQLGNHRLLCGDSTNVQHVERLMGGEKADMVFTDPPYGLAKKWSGGTWADKKMYADAKEWDQPLDQSDIDFFQTLAPSVIIWGGNYYKVPASRCWLSWIKSQQMETMADFELAWTNLDKVAKAWTGARNADGKRDHPTQKPVALMEWGLGFAKSQTVLDLFLGSGSTLIACEKTNRKCFGMEIDAHYCDVILARWEKFTGKSASLVA